MDKTNKRGGGWGTYSNTPECILGRRHPLSTCCFPFKEIYGQMNFGTFFTVLRKDITWRSTTFFFFFFVEAVLMYVCLKLLLSFTWGKWVSSLAFWPALTLPRHFARRCSSLSGALAQQPQRALMLCGTPWLTLFTFTSLHAFYGALFSAWALCYHSACSQPHCFGGDDNT